MTISIARSEWEKIKKAVAHPYTVHTNHIEIEIVALDTRDWPGGDKRPIVQHGVREHLVPYDPPPQNGQRQEG